MEYCRGRGDEFECRTVFKPGKLLETRPRLARLQVGDEPRGTRDTQDLTPSSYQVTGHLSSSRLLRLG